MNTQTVSPREQRQKDRFISKASQTAAKYLRRMEELSGAPESMVPFFRVLRDIYVDGKDVSREDGVKTVGTYCVMAPHELIYAAGAIPVKLCSGSYTAFSIGDDLAPRDACPLVKAVAGFQQIGVMPLYDNCALMVLPITCDCKKKLAGYLAERCEVCTLQIPVSKEDEDIEQYVRELYQFLGVLEETTGNRVTYDSLADAMKKTGYAQFELSRFLRLKKSLPYLLRGTHIMAMMNAASYMPADEWGRQLHLVNRELEQRISRNETVTRRQLPRILLTGSPIIFPNIKIPLLIEEMCGILAADETCMGERGMSDPVVPVDQSFDGLMRSLAIRATRPCSCPTFADNRQRIFRLKQMIRDYQIEGVIYHVLRGCLVYDFEYRQIEEALGELGIPVIRLESDYNEEDVEQLRIRIEAFIELIKLKKPPEVRRTERDYYG